MFTLGSTDVLKNRKVGFLCPRKIPADIITKTYDWAIEQRDNGTCIISGFHSKIEKDVFHFLLGGTQPIILALARGLMKNYDQNIKCALKSKRLLIISPFEESIKRITKDTAYRRNELICELADEIFVPFINTSGLTQQLVTKAHKNGKIIYSIK